jgi:uncharacterized protein (UPF0332 family)
VKEQTSAYLEKASELLDQAETIYSVGLFEQAGRTAYLAGFHAAQPFIFETNGSIHKSHGGLQGEFSRLVRNDPRVDDQIRAFLGRTYDLKSIADYVTGPSSHISAEMAIAQLAARHIRRSAAAPSTGPRGVSSTGAPRSPLAASPPSP